MDVDVVIAGGGPAGLLLASELCLGGVTPVLLERLPAPTGLSKALVLIGRVVQALDYRGLLERFDAGFLPVAAYSRAAHLGGILLDVSRLIDSAPPGHFPPPVPAPQAQVEQVLEERARELGADIRRRHELVGLSQDEDTVSVEVRGPEGTYRLRGRYLVGCDGAHSLVRKQAGIGFPGTAPTQLHCSGKSRWLRRTSAGCRSVSSGPRPVCSPWSRSAGASTAWWSVSGASRPSMSTATSPRPSKSCVPPCVGWSASTLR